VKFEVRDAIAIVGLALIIGGIAHWSKPSAVIVLGAVLFVWAYVTTKPQGPRSGGTAA
jgi:hypothetical protein